MNGISTISLRSLQVQEMIDPRAAANDGTSEVLDAFEQHYRTIRNERDTIVAAMTPDLSRDGRGTAQLASNGPGTAVSHAEGVNGTEVRVSERWTQTTHLVHADGTPMDMGCYTLKADGSRVPFTPAGKAQGERSAAASSVQGEGHAQAYEQRTALYGAVGSD